MLSSMKITDWQPARFCILAVKQFANINYNLINLFLIVYNQTNE